LGEDVCRTLAGTGELAFLFEGPARITETEEKLLDCRKEAEGFHKKRIDLYSHYSKLLSTHLEDLKEQVNAGPVGRSGYPYYRLLHPFFDELERLSSRIPKIKEHIEVNDTIAQKLGHNLPLNLLSMLGDMINSSHHTLYALDRNEPETFKTIASNTCDLISLSLDEFNKYSEDSASGQALREDEFWKVYGHYLGYAAAEAFSKDGFTSEEVGNLLGKPDEYIWANYIEGKTKFLDICPS